MKKLAVPIILMCFIFFPLAASGADERAGEIVSADPSHGGDFQPGLPIPAEVYEKLNAIRMDTDEEISAKLNEIENLSDRSQEGEIQKEISAIKKKALIRQYQTMMEMAQENMDYEAAAVLSDEILRLEAPEAEKDASPSEQEAYEKLSSREGP